MGGAARDREPEEQRNGPEIMLKEGKPEERFQQTGGQAAVESPDNGPAVYICFSLEGARPRTP